MSFQRTLGGPQSTWELLAGKVLAGWLHPTGGRFPSDLRDRWYEPCSQGWLGGVNPQIYVTLSPHRSLGQKILQFWRSLGNCPSPKHPKKTVPRLVECTTGGMAIQFRQPTVEEAHKPHTDAKEPRWAAMQFARGGAE